MSDSFFLDVVADGEEPLLHALEICFAKNAPGGVATCFWVRGPQPNDDDDKLRWDQRRAASHESTLVFYWSDAAKTNQPEARDFLTPVGPQEAAAEALRWLSKVQYGPQPDQDGDNGKGWRVFVEGWGHVLGNHYAVCGVQPAWAMYGK